MSAGVGTGWEKEIHFPMAMVQSPEELSEYGKGGEEAVGRRRGWLWTWVK